MISRLIVFAALFATPAVGQEPPGDAGEIVVYRDGKAWGAAVACPIRFEGVEITELGRGKMARFPVVPGRYILTNKTASVEVHVAPGETRYVRCQIKSGFLSGRSDLQIVDAASFEAKAANLEAAEVLAPISR